MKQPKVKRNLTDVILRSPSPPNWNLILRKTLDKHKISIADARAAFFGNDSQEEHLCSETEDFFLTNTGILCCCPAMVEIFEKSSKDIRQKQKDKKRFAATQNFLSFLTRFKTSYPKWTLCRGSPDGGQRILSLFAVKNQNSPKLCSSTQQTESVNADGLGEDDFKILGYVNDLNYYDACECETFERKSKTLIMTTRLATMILSLPEVVVD